MKKKTNWGLIGIISAVVIVAIAVVVAMQVPSGGLQAMVSGFFGSEIDFSNPVMIGDSITAGYHLGQHHDYDLDNPPKNLNFGTPAYENYTTYLAQQIDISDPSLNLVGTNPPGSYVQPQIEQECADPQNNCVVNPVSSVRFNGQSNEYNLAVPGASLSDALNKRPAVPEGLLCAVGAIPQPCATWGPTELILGFPDTYNWVGGVGQGLINPGDQSQWPARYSQIEKAAQLNPSTLIMWIGNNDVLGYATQGGECEWSDTAMCQGEGVNVASITPVAQFEQDYTNLMSAAKATTASAIINMNIPAITSIPHFFTFDEAAGLLAATSGGQINLTSDQLAYALGLAPDSNTLITLSAFQPSGLDADYIAQNENGGGSIIDVLVSNIANKLHPNYYLNDQEITAIDTATNEFNMIIEDAAGGDKAVNMIDINESFEEINEEGVTISSNWTATTNYGDILFDADGVHPSPFGHAVIANRVIKLINKRYSGITIPEKSLYDFAIDRGYDPSVLGNPVPPEKAKLKAATDVLK